PVFPRKNLAEVHRTLVDVDRGRNRKSELVGAGIRRRNQWKQCLDRQVTRGLSLRHLRQSQCGCGNRHSLTLPHSLITEINESLVFPDRPAAIAAELVADEW